MGNQKTRVDFPIDNAVTGPIVGEDLLATFKAQLILQQAFRIMFGNRGERIFTTALPSLNESILPCIVMNFKSETYRSNNVFLDGFISANLILPVKLMGDYNNLRRVAAVFQRWMGGKMDMFTANPGLIKFGNGTEFNFEGLAKADGVTAPCIQMNIPFTYDLKYLSILNPEFDASADLDEDLLGWIEEISSEIFNQENENILIPEGVILETGQEN